MMTAISCKNCGSNDFEEKGQYRTCQFCGTKYLITEEKDSVGESTIALNEDVSRLLHRWRENPAEADRYAKLILQIDPSNAQAYRQINKPTEEKTGGCYVATAVYGSYDCPEVWTLRRYRDNTLSRHIFGRIFIRFYYAVSPFCVRLLGNTRWFQEFGRRFLNRIVARLQAEGVADTPYQDKNW